MRLGTCWTDICIRNMSARGLMAEAEQPPRPRSYVEVRRGSQIIIGRVIWSQAGRFGLLAQDDIDIDAVVNEPRTGPKRRTLRSGGTEPTERRLDPARHAVRITHAADRSHRVASAMQFVAVLLFCTVAAMLLASGIQRFLNAPLEAITNRL